MMGLLLYYSGATHHEEKLSEIRKYLKQIEEKKEELKTFKSSVEEKLDFIASKVDDFQKFNDLTLKRNAYEYLLKQKKGDDI
jgi:chromosome segregation ATPase